MPLLLDGRIYENDAWQVLDDDATLPNENAQVVVGLRRYLNEIGQHAIGRVSGVQIAPDDDVLLLAPYCDRLQVINIEFPTFSDGRGFSHARLLRQRLNFTGELRATGDVRLEQLPFMTRVGINAFMLAEIPDDNLLKRVLQRYRTSYQPSYPLPAVS